MKNTNLKKLAASIAMFTVIICLFSFINVAKWDAPAADAAVKNPVKSDATSIAAGKLNIQNHAKCVMVQLELVLKCQNHLILHQKNSKAKQMGLFFTKYQQDMVKCHLLKLKLKLITTDGI